jgi:glycosyltransferase involved in cell wall biosynthesis
METLQLIYQKPEKDCTASRRVLLVAPSPPPYGGMAIQARLLEKFLKVDGHQVGIFATTTKCPSWLRLVERVPGLRTIIHTIFIYITLWNRVRWAEVVHVLAASWVYFFAAACPAVVYGRINRKRVVLNYRGGDAEQFFRWYGWLVKPIFRLASVVTAPSKFLAESIEERFGVAVCVVPNILDSSNFQYRCRTSIQPRILITRHLEKLYGVEIAIQAFRRVQSQYPDASLWIAGTGGQKEYLLELVAGWNLRNVRFLGYVEHRDLGAVYDHCDILLNASFVDNFPGSLLEASGAGLVVISTAAGGIPFMFQHEKTALLVEPGDWNGLARAVERVIQSPSLGLNLAREAATMARSWHWGEVRKAVYATYEIT